MKSLAGKKALCFIALPHHNRFLVPIMEALQAQGMETVYFTVPAEGAFEITLNHANLPYRHIMDYGASEARRVADAFEELRPVMQKKILGNRTLQSVPVVIQDKVIRGVVEMNRMIEVEKPDLLFALHELNPWGKILGYLSHVHRVPYFTLQEGLYYADIHYYRFHTDYSTACLVWGEDCRRILLRAGCSDDKIFPVGNTHIWQAKEEFTSAGVVGATRNKLGIGLEKKIVLFLMSHSHYRPFDARIFLQWMKTRGDVAAVFKWHPVTGKEIIDRAFENLKGSPDVHSIHDIDTYALIGASDICVTVGNSTTGLEALAFGKPLIEVRLPDQEYSFVEQGVAESASGFENLGERCEAILAQNLPRERRQRVESYLADNFAHQDARTMERIVPLVEASLKARASADEKPAPLPSSGETAFPCSILLPVDDAAPEALLMTLEGIAAHTAAELYEVLIVDCSRRTETKALLSTLSGDVTIIAGEPDWNYAQACNRAAAEARGKYLVLLSPGLFPYPGWLEALLAVVEEEGEVGVVGAALLNENGLLWNIGIAFDVNQAPFSIYRLLPLEFSGARRRREFRATQVPLLAPRELFLRLGGFGSEMGNRFFDIDFCLRVERQGRKIFYAPESRVSRQVPSWPALAEQEPMNRVRFYSKWTGSLWQDDAFYLEQDGLTHDTLSAHYRELAGRVAAGAKQLEKSQLDAGL